MKEPERALNNGPGQYNEAMRFAVKQTGAEAAVIVVRNGVRGNGFEFCAKTREALATLPRTLRIIAAEIEEELNRPETKTY